MSKTASEMDQHQYKMAEILFDDAYYTYEFDVTTGMIGSEIVGRNGYNYTKAATVCSFDDMVQRVLYGNNSNVEFTIDSGMQELSCAALLKAYEEGKRRVELKLHSKQPHAYHRLTYLLDHDEETGHVMAYVLCQDITEIEKQWIRENTCAQRELEDTESILSCAGVGTWHINLFDNEKPSMKASAKMLELLGITDEELYHIVCHSEGLSGAEILNVVINAATFALNREGIQCQVRLRDFELAIEGVKKAKRANCQV